MAVKEIRVLICDDDREYLDAIHQKAETIFAKLNIQGIFDLYSISEAVAEDSLKNLQVQGLRTGPHGIFPRYPHRQPCGHSP